MLHECIVLAHMREQFLMRARRKYQHTTDVLRDMLIYTTKLQKTLEHLLREAEKLAEKEAKDLGTNND